MAMVTDVLTIYFLGTSYDWIQEWLGHQRKFEFDLILFYWHISMYSIFSGGPSIFDGSPMNKILD